MSSRIWFGFSPPSLSLAFTSHLSIQSPSFPSVPKIQVPHCLCGSVTGGLPNVPSVAIFLFLSLCLVMFHVTSSGALPTPPNKSVSKTPALVGSCPVGCALNLYLNHLRHHVQSPNSFHSASNFCPGAVRLMRGGTLPTLSL